MAEQEERVPTNSGSGGAFAPSQVLADNVRSYRGLLHLTQDELGARMAALGHEWTGGIVGFVERRSRAVAVDELCGLAVCLGVTLGQLLDPTGPAFSHRRSLDLGIPGDTSKGFDKTLLAPWEAQLWTNSRTVYRFWSGGVEEPMVELGPELHPSATKALERLRERGEWRPWLERQRRRHSAEGETAAQ